MRFHILDNSMNKAAVTAVLNCNRISSAFGLTLTPEQAAELIDTRSKALRAAGRLEFGGGVIEKLVFEFSDSAYIQQSDYADTMNYLVELFYMFKSASEDKLNDDELIHFMRDAFERSDGSLELVEGREFESLLESLKGEK
ncbi:hypothetical protein SDC9_128927 [bioreactor metagenome]|uniref:Uncharacterized protein n=1 Tax=bioreactor metagenome TaxID=1076179 RepID=A0A645CXG3_9ZZZZ|nr:DUF6323 family protein [Candidatus Metalachnospira sp.]